LLYYSPNFTYAGKNRKEFLKNVLHASFNRRTGAKWISRTQRSFIIIILGVAIASVVQLIR